MIFVRDKGRMCNNILQYAHMYAWGREHGVTTMSMRFAYKYQYFHICHTRYHWFPVYLFAKYAAKLGLIKTVSFHEQQSEEQQSRRLLSAGNLYMVEGWQVRFYDLFLKYKDEILQLFAFDKKITYSVDKLCTAYAGDNETRIGVHIRRGDYKTWNGGRYFFDDDVYIAYIRRYVAGGHCGNVTVYVCGNDPALDKDYYTRQLPGIHLVFPHGNPAEDLCLLSRCSCIIGAPSTFSLVAAMYRDIPLCWILNSDASTMRFDRFNNLFRNII